MQHNLQLQIKQINTYYSMNPQIKQQFNEDIIASLCSKEHYFLVYPYTNEQLQSNPALAKLDPIVLVYKDNDEMKIQELVEKYVKQIDNKEQKQTFTFKLQDGFRFTKTDTIGQAKRKLRRQCLDGVKLYADPPQEEWGLECAMMNFLEKQKSYNKGALDIPYEIEPGKYFGYLKIKPKEKEDKELQEKIIKQQICNEIQLKFGKTVTYQNVSVKTNINGKNEELKEDDILRLTANDKMTVTVKNTQLKLPHEIKNHLIIKGDKIGTKHITYDKNIPYENIKGKKVMEILKQLNNEQEWDEFGLLIGEQVLKNNDFIEKKVGQMFEPSVASIKHIAAIIVTESQIFELEQKKIAKVKKMDLQTIIYKEVKNTEYRQKCNKIIRERAQNASIIDFTDPNNVLPIFLYTTELKVHGSLNDKISSIYRNLNELLRSQNFAQVPQSDYEKKWEYQFNWQLQEQLRKIKTLQAKELWRGVSYKPDHKIGQIIIYKQFISSSRKQTTAKTFANEALFKFIKPLQGSFSGKCIKDYSFFVTEDQVLFPPYTYFEVKQVSEIENETKKKKVKYFVLEEVSKKPIPQNIVNFILWVDDKTAEGKAIWNSFQNIKNSTVMIQLLSTHELQNWLIKHKQIISDPTTSISMISNMTRIENGVPNGYAGVDAIEVFRNHLPHPEKLEDKQAKGNIFLYIGNKKLAIQKLQKRKLMESSHLEVSSVPQKLRDFLKKYGDIQ